MIWQREASGCIRNVPSAGQGRPAGSPSPMRFRGGDHGPLSPPTYLTLDDGAKLHVPESELDRSRRAFGALRQSHPGIVIDSDYDALEWHEGKKVLLQYEFPNPSALKAAPAVTFWNCWQWRK